MPFRLLLLSVLLIPVPLAAITGGKPVTAGDAPWMAALVDLSRDDDPVCTESGGSEYFCKQFCGAALIAPQWLLTAAHCLDTVPSVAGLRALIDTPDLNDPAPRVLEIHSKYVQPNYSEGGFRNDIALLLLREPVDDIVPASLVTETAADWLDANGEALNDPLTVFGWGRLSTSGAFPPVLQRVSLDLMPASACTSVYNTTDIIQFVEALMLCVAETTPGAIEADDVGDVSPRDENGEDACSYDSGGPLLMHHDGARQVAGVVSFGGKATCGRTDRPAVYTRIIPQLTWLEQQLPTPAFAGAPGRFADLSLAIDLPAYTVNSSENVTVQLRNRSLLVESAPAQPVVTVQVSDAVATLTGASGFNCVAGAQAGEWLCTYLGATMPRNAQASVTLSLSASEPSQVQVRAQVAAPDYQDYRSADNDLVRTMTVSPLPDVWLESPGVVAENVTDYGDIWLFLDYGNASDRVDSADLVLRISHDADYLLQDDDGLDCQVETASSYLCTLTGLVMASSRQSRLQLRSDGLQDGTISVELVSPVGYPLARVASQAVVAFFRPDDDEIPRDPDPDPDPEPGPDPEPEPINPLDTGGGVFFLLPLILLASRRSGAPPR